MKLVLAAMVTAVVLCAVQTTVLAHEVTFKGTVTSVASSDGGKVINVAVDVTDTQTKKTSSKVFEIDDETKVLRGDVVVKFADVKIDKGEQISITVNIDDSTTLADTVRLPVKK